MTWRATSAGPYQAVASGAAPAVEWQVVRHEEKDIVAALPAFALKAGRCRLTSASPQVDLRLTSG